MTLAFMNGRVDLSSYDDLNLEEVLEFVKKFATQRTQHLNFLRYFPRHLQAKLDNSKMISKRCVYR